MFLFFGGSCFSVVLGSCVSDAMISNQVSLLTSSNLFGKTQYKSRKDLWVV